MDNYIVFVEQAQNGNQQERRQAFDELLPHFQTMAFQVAYSVLSNVHLAEDVVQESFLKAYLQIHQLREPQAFPAWLKRIVLTQSDRAIRGQQPTIETLDTQLDFATDNTSPESLLEVHEMQDQVLYAIESLPEHERAVTEGFYMQGESQKEIAERLKVPVTTVKKRLQYARQHLRLIIGDLNAVVDEAIARVLQPSQQQPQRQPVYIYSKGNDPTKTDDSY